jgi:hypothetical protein
MSACAATTTATSASKAVCAIWQPVTWADADTDQTIREVKAGNAARKSYCGN